MVLDAFALVALAADEPAAAEVEALLRRGDVSVTSVNLAEVIDVLGRARGHDLDRVREVFAPLAGEVLTVLDVGADAAWHTAELRGRHYDRKSSPLSLADCFALAAGIEDGALATADAPLAAAARAEGVDVVALPASDGTRP